MSTLSKFRSSFSALTMISLLTSPGLFASTNTTQNWQTELIQGASPLAAFAMGAVRLQNLEPHSGTTINDGGSKNYFELVLVSSAFGTGAELSAAIGRHFNVAASAAQALGGAGLYLALYAFQPGEGTDRSPLGAFHAKIWPSAQLALMAGVNNQVGQSYRRLIDEQQETIAAVAKSLNVSESNLVHVNDGLKTMGALGAFHLILTTERNLGAAFTSAYLLREGILQHAAHASEGITPALVAGSILSVAGAVGSYHYASGAPGVVAAASLEAGAYSFLEGGVQYLLIAIPSDYKALALNICQMSAAAIGGLIYVPNPVTPAQRMRNTITGALMFNAAYASVEFAKYLASHLIWQN